MSNGVRQGGVLSPQFFNQYMNDLTKRLNEIPAGSGSGNIVINHLMYADDVVLLSPSAKDLQKLADATYKYGTENDIIYNGTKSQVMFFDTRKTGNVTSIRLGDIALNFASSYKYLGHIITA